MDKSSKTKHVSLLLIDRLSAFFYFYNLKKIIENYAILSVIMATVYKAGIHFKSLLIGIQKKHQVCF